MQADHHWVLRPASLSRIHEVVLRLNSVASMQIQKPIGQKLQTSSVLILSMTHLSSPICCARSMNAASESKVEDMAPTNRAGTLVPTTGLQVKN